MRRFWSKFVRWLRCRFKKEPIVHDRFGVRLHVGDRVEFRGLLHRNVPLYGVIAEIKEGFRFVSGWPIFVPILEVWKDGVSKHIESTTTPWSADRCAKCQAGGEDD